MKSWFSSEIENALKGGLDIAIEFNRSSTENLAVFRDSFVFENIDSPVVPSLLRDFSAPIRLKYDYRHSDYAFLMEYDTDPFNKFEASQNFAKEIMLDMYKNDILFF